MTATVTKSVPLATPFQGHNGLVREIILREPTGDEFLTYGEPQTWVRVAGGMALIDNDQAIRAYIERLIVQPDPVLTLSQIKLADARAVRKAVIDFFTVEPLSGSSSSPVS
jgi:hypothetical protein